MGYLPLRSLDYSDRWHLVKMFQEFLSIFVARKPTSPGQRLSNQDLRMGVLIYLTFRNSVLTFSPISAAKTIRTMGHPNGPVEDSAAVSLPMSLPSAPNREAPLCP